MAIFAQDRRRPSLLPTEPTDTPPVRAFLLAALFAVAGGVAAVYPLIGIVILLAGAAVTVLYRTLVLPKRGIYLTLWIFPWYTLLRSAMWCYYPRAPMAITRFWQETLLTVMLGGILLRFILYRERVRLTRHDIPVLLILASGVYSLVLTILDQSYLNAAFGVYYSLTPVLLYFVVRWTRLSRADVTKLLATLLLSFTLVIFVSYVDYIVHPDFMLRIYKSAKEAYFQGDLNDVRTYVSTVYLRMQSVLLEEDFWGALCSFISLLCTAYISTVRVKKRLVVLMLLCYVGMALSMSRGSVIGWMAGMFALAVLHRGRRFRVLMIIAAILVTLTTAYLATMTDVRVRQLTGRATSSSQGQKGLGIDPGRKKQFTQGLDSFQRIPSGLGLGQSGYSVLWTKMGAPLVTDGFYVYLLVDEGIPGAILWLIALPGMGWVIWQRSQRAANGEIRALGVGLLAWYVHLVVHGIFANVWDYNGVPLIYFIFLAVFMKATDEVQPN